MLTITVPASETFNEATNEFIEIKEQTLVMEHSLVSLSKWESKWCKPFLSPKPGEEITQEEFDDYMRCMVITPGNIDIDVITYMPAELKKQIADYIHSPMTATWFSETDSKGKSKDTITSELIYYWMIAANIPFECQKWHLNRLITLIRICELKNNPGKKMSKKDIFNQNKALNAARRAKFGSKG